MSQGRIPVAILGATGTVGQKLVRRLADHPWFEVRHLAASPASVGRRYRDLVRWREATPLPDAIGDLVLAPSDVPEPFRIVFSALDTETAETVEPRWAANGSVVITNASPYRLATDVPLIIPEVNADHLAMLAYQRRQRGWACGIVANPNCTTTGLALVLAPLHRTWGVERLFVSTMQAISGAGWPGVSSLDLVGNVVPFIANEEEKVERETVKLLGRVNGAGVKDAPIAVSAHTNRVPVIDGHLETVSVALAGRPSPAEVASVLAAWRAPEDVRSLPTSPDQPLFVAAEADRPQPRLDLERGNGMTVSIGRIRSCPVLDIRLVLLSHNTVRGAAGAAIQNAELVVSRGGLNR
jgi:aspartate-semialdehyde dehydrogenase